MDNCPNCSTIITSNYIDIGVGCILEPQYCERCGWLQNTTTDLAKALMELKKFEKQGGISS
jgi:hypothetical protein